MISQIQMAVFADTGHVTCAPFFDESQIDMLGKVSEDWTETFIADLDDEKRAWYCEGLGKGETRIRKLDNPVFHKDEFRALAKDQNLVSAVEALIGSGVSVAFSQIFFKPAHGGGPKPAHQDNFYFGCNDRDGMVTAWVALDDATVENGCMYFGDGSNKGPLIDHIAPEGEPFNLQIPETEMQKIRMTPAPVPKGGVSFHHGHTIHQSSDNTSAFARRAVAIHYVNQATTFENPALAYDHSIMVKIS